MTPHDLLLRAGLLAGLGAEASGVARALADLVEAPDGRSCLDADSPLQVTIDSPGPARLRVGVRTNGRIDAADLSSLTTPATARHLADLARRVPAADHASLGTWLFWSPSSSSLYVDLRHPDEEDALARVDALVGRSWRDRLRNRRPAGPCRPWAVRVGADDEGITTVQVLWLVRRGTDIPDLVDRISPASWPAVRDTFARLLRRPAHSGRFVVTTPLDDRCEPGLRIGSTGWALAPDGDAKRRSLASLVDDLDGPRNHAEAMWSLCRADPAGRRRVGRACEVRVTDRIRARLFLVPHLRSHTPADSTPARPADRAVLATCPTTPRPQTIGT